MIFFIFLFFVSLAGICQGTHFLRMLMTLLYTDFSYFSTVFLPVLPLFSSCWSCYATATPLVAWWWRGSSWFPSCWSCPFMLSPVFLMFDYAFLPCSHCWSCFLHCPPLISSLSPHVILRRILMRIVTILWFVWFDDCLRLSVKLSFSVPLLPVLFLYLSSVLFLSLFTAMMILFSICFVDVNKKLCLEWGIFRLLFMSSWFEDAFTGCLCFYQLVHVALVVCSSLCRSCHSSGMLQVLLSLWGRFNELKW